MRPKHTPAAVLAIASGPGMFCSLYCGSAHVDSVQMEDTAADVAAGGHSSRVSGSKVSVDGFDETRVRA